MTATALLLSLVLAQGYAGMGSQTGSGGPPGAGGGGKVLASFPLSTTGPLIAEDALTVAHVYWNDTTIVDTKGNVWAQNGTVPHVASTPSPFIPGKNGAGPFSDANYYSLAAGSVVDFAGDFTACFVVNPSSSVDSTIFDLCTTSTGGWKVQQQTLATNFYTCKVAAPGYVGSTVGSGLTVGAPNVLCVGRSGANQYIKLNLIATVSTATTATTNPGQAALMGRQIPAAQPFLGTIYEFYATSTPWSEATVTAIQQRVLGHFDGTSPLTVTRATLGTYIPRAADGVLYTAAPGVARITEDGLLVEPARTNYALQSNTMSTGTAATAPWALNGGATVATVAGAPMGGTWAEVTASSNTQTMNQPITTASSTTFVYSAWMMKSTVDIASLLVKAGAQVITSCTCLRSDGGSCTATINPGAGLDTTFCQAKVTNLTTTPIRLSLIFVTTAAITDPSVYAIPGEYSVSNGTTRFSGAQLEIGTYPTSLIVTAGTAVARNADAISATVPAVPSKWCVAVTAKPEEGRAWGYPGVGYASLFSTGNADNNTFTFGFDNSEYLYGHIYDSGGTASNTYWDATPLGSASHRLVTCTSDGRYLNYTVDGVFKNRDGVTGTGIGTTFGTTTLYLGVNGTGSNYWGGYLKGVKLCASKAKECK